MLDKELIDIFMGSLHDPYLEKMICNGTSSFSDLVIVGECIDSMLRSIKFPNTLSIQASDNEPFIESQEEEEDIINLVWEIP